MVLEEAALCRPVVSVPLDNGSLVSCCRAVQCSAASLSTLHSTSFPALPWTLHVPGTHKAFFLLSKMLLSFLKEEHTGYIHRWGSLGVFRNSSNLLVDSFSVWKSEAQLCMAFNGNFAFPVLLESKVSSSLNDCLLLISLTEQENIFSWTASWCLSYMYWLRVAYKCLGIFGPWNVCLIMHLLQ